MEQKKFDIQKQKEKENKTQKTLFHFLLLFFFFDIDKSAQELQSQHKIDLKKGKKQL